MSTVSINSRCEQSSNKAINVSKNNYVAAKCFIHALQLPSTPLWKFTPIRNVWTKKLLNVTIHLDLLPTQQPCNTLLDGIITNAFVSI